MIRRVRSAGDVTSADHGAPTAPGWYVRCVEAWIGPFRSQDAAVARVASIAADPRTCPHAHTVEEISA